MKSITYKDWHTSNPYVTVKCLILKEKMTSFLYPKCANLLPI